MASSSTSLFFFFSLLLLSLLSFSSAQPFSNAVEILSASGHKFMSRALNSASNSALSKSPSLTVFAPADEAFTDSVQPGPILLHYHLLPVAFPLRSLKSLPFGAKIASLLTVTTLPADRLVSLNNRFFDPYFRISGPILSYGGYGSKNLCCLVTMLTVFAPVDQAMMSRIGKRKERQREKKKDRELEERGERGCP